MHVRFASQLVSVRTQCVRCSRCLTSSSLPASMRLPCAEAYGSIQISDIYTGAHIRSLRHTYGRRIGSCGDPESDTRDNVAASYRPYTRLDARLSQL